MVVLNIFREGWSESKDFEIQRAVINIPSLRYETKEGNIAYVKMFQFSETLRTDFRDVARTIEQSGSKKIIIDLRNNPGGFLHVAVDIAGYFVDRGDVVVIEDFGEGQDRLEHKARGTGALKDYQVVVLMNTGSASASEILAGALRDNNNVLLIGEKSFGKGSVQEIKKLKDDSSIKITIAKWLTPNGNLIAQEGLEPDIEVEMTEEDFQEGSDPQLKKAIEVLNNL
jgi:carboxyl-terminal processing protease